MQLVEEQIHSSGSPCDSVFNPMSDAIQRARASIGDFFAALRLPRNGQTDFRIQAVFEDGDEREQIWLSELNFSTRPATGLVSTRSRIKTIAYRKRVPFRPEQMSDWMYNDNGRVVGAHTLRVPLTTESDRGGIFSRLKRRFIN